MVLLPVLDQRVVVALGATDVYAEEDRGGLVRQFVEFPDARLEKRQSRFDFGVVFAADQHVAEHLVPRAAVANGLEQVLAPFVVASLLGAHQQRVEFIPKVEGKVGRGHQSLNQLHPLVGIGRIHVPARFGHRRDTSRHIERRSPDQRAIVCERCGLNLLLGQTLLHVLIDRLLDRHLGREQLPGHNATGGEATPEQQERTNQSHENSDLRGKASGRSCHTSH